MGERFDAPRKLRYVLVLQIPPSLRSDGPSGYAAQRSTALSATRGADGCPLGQNCRRNHDTPYRLAFIHARVCWPLVHWSSIAFQIDIKLLSRGRPMGRNALLNRIPAVELRRLLSASELVTLVPRQVLHHSKLPIKDVHFVEHGLVSVTAKTFTEVWLIGTDGMVGVPLILALHNEPLYRRTVQVAGDAFRIASEPFRQMLPSLPNLRRLLDAYLSTVRSNSPGRCLQCCASTEAARCAVAAARSP